MGAKLQVVLVQAPGPGPGSRVSFWWPRRPANAVEPPPQFRGLRGGA